MLIRWLETVKTSHVNHIRRIELYGTLDLMYRTRGRHYHTLDHIEHCFREFDNFPFPKAVECYKTEMEIALWCHDAFYDVKNKDNELCSANLAEEICHELAGHSRFFAPRVSEFVLLTKHDKEPEDEAGKILTDIDLSVLGQSYGVYRKYQENIQKEYNAESDWKAFAEGRIRILESLLKRNKTKIYYTDHFYSKCGEAAFTNMNRELIEMQEKLKRI